MALYDRKLVVRVSQRLRNALISVNELISSIGIVLQTNQYQTNLRLECEILHRLDIESIHLLDNVQSVLAGKPLRETRE